ncbi:MAG TPA: hypothetical protein VMW30_07675 [Candidatus Paceibacterota bacterium]|nr:hypothetical protein [Candidatus Paceibacterota bacterium]
MSLLLSGSAYQVTDLQRDARTVIDEARDSSALIRDKDGLMLIIQPADVAQQMSLISDLMGNSIRLGKALRRPPSDRDISSYGTFAWVSMLAEEDQREFLQDLLDQVLVSHSSGSTSELEDFIGDWKATALVHSDEELRDELTGDLDSPLSDVVL